MVSKSTFFPLIAFMIKFPIGPKTVSKYFTISFESVRQESMTERHLAASLRIYLEDGSSMRSSVTRVTNSVI
jgi:hypothetical protein